MYPELLTEKGIMGERGGKGETEDIEILKFYPIDPGLPPVIQLKLQCKEINFLLDRLQKSLQEKMQAEHTIPRAEVYRLREQEKYKREGNFEEDFLKPHGLKRLQNGQVVKDE